MALNDHTTLKGITNFRDDQLSSNLECGIIDFFRWAFLGIGAFQNVAVDSTSVFGGERSHLQTVSDPRYTDGQLWQGYRSDWIWETGVGYSVDPIVCSGVYVNDTFYPSSGEGDYSHHIDFLNGRVVFDDPVESGEIKTSFSFRDINFISTDNPWMNDLMFNSFDVDSEQFALESSGNWNQPAEIRAQLPSVGVEVVGPRGYKGYQIGGGQWVFMDVLFHVFTENAADKKAIRDILSNQNDKTIWIPDRQLMKTSDSWPIDTDYRGMVIDEPMTYPQVVSQQQDGGFAWRKVSFSNTSVQDLSTINDWLHRAIVRTTLQVIMSNI